MSKQAFCYWCGAPATSREHVPPKCLFPELKDTGPIFNESYREHLITVPSCDKHNLSKSNDDQYLMLHLAPLVGNNSIAYIHTKTKLARTLERKPYLLDIKGEANLKLGAESFPVCFVECNLIRLSYSFEAIARALYFVEYGIAFKGECKVFSNIYANQNDMEAKAFILDSVCKLEDERKSCWKSKIKGFNPKIFTYQFSPVDDLGTQTICLTFYERTKVFVILVQPENPKMKFIKRNHPTR